MVVYKKVILFLFFFLIASLDPGAIESPDSPKHLFSPSNIRITNEYTVDDVYLPTDKTIKNFMRMWGIQGASVSVAKDGEIIYAKGFGVTDTLTLEKVEPYHKFRIASISKLITAIAIMRLEEDGKLSVDDKVFGPDGILNDSFYANPKDKRVYDITITHLLTHEGGWSQRYGDQMFMPFTVANKMGVSPPVDTKTIVRFVLDKNLHFTPGRGRSYSNLGYSILGLVIEKVSGVDYETYCKRNVLEPLGIFDMELAHNLYDEKRPYEVSYYTPADIELKPSIYGTGEFVVPTYGGNDIESLGGAGAWVATSPDLMKLLLAVDGLDSYPDILSDESIRYMTGSSAAVGWKSTYKSGIWIRTGSFPGTAGMMKRLPNGTAWVVLFNTSTWKGPMIHSSINSMMSRVMALSKKWPERDLMPYYFPSPLSLEELN